MIFRRRASQGGKVLQKIADAHRRIAASGRAGVPDPRASGVRDSKSRERRSMPPKMPRAGNARRSATSEIAALDAAFPRGAKPRSLPML